MDIEIVGEEDDDEEEEDEPFYCEQCGSFDKLKEYIIFNNKLLCEDCYRALIKRNKPNSTQNAFAKGVAKGIRKSFRL